MFNAYLIYAARNGIEPELDETGPSKWSFIVHNPEALALFDREKGRHCVQRVPSNGRGHKHTSYVTVMVNPLIARYVEMKECDLEETFQRGSQGAGGQNANKVNSAVRLRHKPTGLEVFINGRDQIKNRATARQALAGKIESFAKSQAARADYGGAGRGSKIRTYNLADSRVTDHRTGAKCNQPDRILKRGEFELLK